MIKPLWGSKAIKPCTQQVCFNSMIGTGGSDAAAAAAKEECRFIEALFQSTTGSQNI
jgi:hypothetical protein